MVQNPLLQQGIELMLYGMGTVLTFLVLLIFATILMTSFLGKYFKEEPIEVQKKPSTNIVKDDKLNKILKEAIAQYRANKK